MKPIGIIFLIIGIIIGVFALSMDTSVEVDYHGESFGLPERVNNLGLMNEKQNYLIVSGVITLIGFLIVFNSKDKKDSKKIVAFKETLEKAKIAEYKNDYRSSIDFYLETLYHLENDYINSNLSKQSNVSRLKLIEDLKIKIEELKRKF